MPRSARLALAGCAVLLLALAGSGDAFHWFRGDEHGGSALGCSPTDGATSDAPAQGPVGATVALLHNAFSDSVTGLPVSVIRAGQSVRWVWESAHCHSATGGTPLGAPQGFDSGFHYPVTAPPTPMALPGFFDYPVLELGQVGPLDTGTPTLSFTHTFPTPGTYTYYCVHHYELGMVGVVVVQ